MKALRHMLKRMLTKALDGWVSGAYGRRTLRVLLVRAAAKMQRQWVAKAWRSWIDTMQIVRERLLEERAIAQIQEHAGDRGAMLMYAVEYSNVKVRTRAHPAAHCSLRLRSP